MTTTPKALPAKWRKKPVVIEAWCIDPSYPKEEAPDWVLKAFADERIDWCPAGEGLYVQTLEGLMLGLMGDMLIQGVKGELYPCKPDVFAATYEPADSLASAGGVEVVAYLVSGGRIFKDHVVHHEGVALTRIAERKDGSVAEPLVRQTAHLAALSAQSTAADEMAELLRDARDDVNDCLNAVLPNAGYERYDRRIKDFQDRLARIDAALAAHEAKSGRSHG